MPIEDYLLRQFEQMGRVLGLILARLMGLKNSGRVDEGIGFTNQTLKDELDLDLDRLLEIPDNDLVKYLLDEKKFGPANLEQLAEILLLIADGSDPGLIHNELRVKYYAKCLAILNYLEVSETTYSLDRHLKIERIKAISR